MVSCIDMRVNCAGPRVTQSEIATKRKEFEILTQMLQQSARSRRGNALGANLLRPYALRPIRLFAEWSAALQDIPTVKRKVSRGEVSIFRKMFFCRLFGMQLTGPGMPTGVHTHADTKGPFSAKMSHTQITRKFIVRRRDSRAASQTILSNW